MKIPENKTALIFDLFFYLIFMPLLIFLGPVHYWINYSPLFFILTCVFFYGCYFFIKRLDVPSLLIGKRYRLLALVAVGIITVNFILTRYPLPDIDFITPAMSEYQTNVRNYSVSIGMWLMLSLVVAYSLTVSFVCELYDHILLKKKIENQRDKAQLAMFKAQISPHFLFNTLNSLYSLVIGTSQKAEDAFIKFTEILKYTYVTIDNEYVALRDELTYIQNYIDLQMLRLNEHTDVRCDYVIDDDQVEIPPMILLTFVENAFKYGSSTSVDCRIVISLTMRNGVLELVTRNRVMRHADSFRTEMPAGIQNCRARLAALYPGRHSLVTEERDGNFTVKMIIEIG